MENNQLFYFDSGTTILDIIEELAEVAEKYPTATLCTTEEGYIVVCEE